MARKMETCLIYRIYEYLCVLEREGTNHLFLIFTRKDSLDQGNALKGSICKSNQSPARYSVAVEREREGSGRDRYSRQGGTDEGDVPLSGEEDIVGSRGTAGAGWGPCPPRLGIEFWGGFNALVFVGGSSRVSMLRMSISVPRVALTSFTCAAITANFEKEVAHEDGGGDQGVQKACSPHGWSHERVNGSTADSPKREPIELG